MLREFYKLGALLAFSYLLILLAWFLYLVRRLIISNKILSGRKRHESSSQHRLSVYNAKTQVVKHRYLLAIMTIEIMSIFLLFSTYLFFSGGSSFWYLGDKELKKLNNSHNFTNHCMIYPQVFALSHYPYAMLLPTLSHLLLLLLLTMLSIQTHYLETRYRFSSHSRAAFKFLISLSVQALVLILTCFSRYTVLFEPFLFLVFFAVDLVRYIWYFHRLKLVVKGRLFEISTFENYSQKFTHDKRAFRRFVILTSLFCIGLIYPSIFFSFDFYIHFFLIPSPRLCTFEVFYRNDNFANYVAIDESQIHWYLEFVKFIPPFIILPFILLILPHIAYAVFWLIDKVKKRSKSLIFFADPLITQPLI